MKAVNRKIAQHATKAQANIFDAIDQLQEVVRLAEMDAFHEFSDRVQNLGMDLEMTLSRIASVIKNHIADTTDADPVRVLRPQGIDDLADEH